MNTVIRTRAAWGDAAPEWILVLAEHCDHSSQKAVADQIGYSSAVVNQVLSGRYSGDMGAVEQAVKGALLNTTVSCPVAGDLPAHRCLEYQRLPFAATNPQRIALYKACRTCPHNRRNHHE